MTQMRFYDAASGLLTPEAFNFMVSHLLKHAERTQEFLTLVVFIAERASRDAIGAVEDGVLTDIGRLISRAVRKTDLMARTTDGMLSLMLSGIDMERAMAVIERLNEHLWRYRMSPALQISVGVACCPTHAIHVDELLQAAISRRIHGDLRHGPRTF
jgi:diguanylate cyclase (GGDEF)-like protein